MGRANHGVDVWRRAMPTHFHHRHAFTEMNRKTRAPSESESTTRGLPTVYDFPVNDVPKQNILIGLPRAPSMVIIFYQVGNSARSALNRVHVSSSVESSARRVLNRVSE